MSTTSTTIYSGFHRKLKDRRLSWEDRLKIARYAWTTPAAFIPNKHQVLLDWLFGALLNKKKLKINDRDALYIWVTLNDFIRSNFVRGLALKTQLLSLRSSATQVMTEALARASLSTAVVDTKLLSWMLGACHGVLTSSPVAYLLTSRTKVLNVILSSSLRLLLQMLKQEEEDAVVSDSAMETEEKSTDQQQQQPQQQQNQQRVTPQLKKVVEAFATAAVDAFTRSKGRRGGDERQILQFFLDEVMETLLSLLLGDRLSRCSDGETLRTKLTSLSNAVLYNSDHKIHYDHYLNRIEASKVCPEKLELEEAAPEVDAESVGASSSSSSKPVAKAVVVPPLIKSVFEKLHRHVSTDPHFVASSMMNGLKSMNVASNRRFTAAVHLTETTTSKDAEEEVSSSDVSVMNAIFRHVAEDNLVDSFSETAKTRLNSALGAALSFASEHPPTASLFRLLVDLLKCDPHILDPVAAKALGLTLVEKNRCDSLDETSNARDHFFAFFIQLYKKLRRLDKFFLHLHIAVVQGFQLTSAGMSTAALKTVEEVGTDLPLGTVLTIWENLHEAIVALIEKSKELDDDQSSAGRRRQSLSTLLLVEVAFLQKLVLANHELPENLSAQIHACVVSMGEVESRTRGVISKDDEDAALHAFSQDALHTYHECLKRLETMLRFYLPHRHPFPATDPFVPLALGDTVIVEVIDEVTKPSDDQIQAMNNLYLAPVNWLPYSPASLDVKYLHVLTRNAVENLFALPPPVDDKLRRASLAFLKDETNHEIPNFARQLFLSLLPVVARDFVVAEEWMEGTHNTPGYTSRGRVDLLLDLLKTVPFQNIETTDLDILVVKLFRLIDYHLDDAEAFTGEEREKVVVFVEAILTDFPQALVPLKVSELISLLTQCQRFLLLGSPTRQCERVNDTPFSRAVVSIAVKLIKMCFLRENVAPLCSFFESLLTSVSAKDFPDSMVQFLLPLYFVSWHGLQRLEQRSNPADDLKLQRLKFAQVVENITTYLVRDVFAKEDEELSILGVASIVKTLVSTRYSTLIHGDDDAYSIADKMMERLVYAIDRIPEDLTTSQRNALLECLVAVLRKPRYAKLVKSHILASRDGESIGIDGFILKLLPPLPNSGVVAKETSTEAVPTASVQLPTETLSILDRFLGEDEVSGESSQQTEDSPAVDEAMDETLSNISKPTSVAEVPIQSLDSSSQESTASLVDSLLRCMLALHQIQSSFNEDDDDANACDVANAMISFISVENIDVDYRRLDLALRFCLDNFDASTSPSKPISKKSTRQFIEAVQNLAVGLGLRCRDGSSMSSIERSVALSILLCLKKFLAFNPKKKSHTPTQGNNEKDEEEEEHVTLKPMASVAVEVLLALPLPVDKDFAGDVSSSKTASTEFFLRYVEVVNSLFVNHSHRVFSMAPAFFMTVDKSLKILTGICEQLLGATTSGGGGGGGGELDENREASALRKRTRDCANALLRLATLFRPQKAELSKLAPYWISHLTRALTSTPAFGVDSRVLRDLNGCVFCLMDLMDDFGFDILRTLLPDREKELLYKLKKEYEATFKFKGKI